jgi:hypothetical protein
MKDNAETEEESRHKLKQIFSNLSFILKRHNLEPVGEPVAWHSKRGNLFVVEGGNRPLCQLSGCKIKGITLNSQIN